MALSMKGPVRLKFPRDPLFRLLAVNGLAGTAIAGLVLGGIFLGNIGNLRVLVMSAEDPFCRSSCWHSACSSPSGPWSWAQPSCCWVKPAEAEKAEVGPQGADCRYLSPGK